MCTNSFRAFMAAWLDSFQRSRDVEFAVDEAIGAAGKMAVISLAAVYCAIYTVWRNASQRTSHGHLRRNRHLYLGRLVHKYYRNITQHKMHLSSRNSSRWYIPESYLSIICYGYITVKNLIVISVRLKAFK